MASLKFTNFASTTVATAVVGTGDLTLAVSAGTGSLFPTLSGGNYFYATLVDSLTAPTKKEIVKVTAVSTDTFTIVRAQDGTTAQTWVTGNYIALRTIAAWFTDTSWLNISGTTNQITVANSGSAITLSTPQDINDAANPTFAGMSLSGLTYKNIVFPNPGGVLTGTTDFQWTSGSADAGQNLKINGGLSAATLAIWTGIGYVMRMTVGVSLPGGLTEAIVFEPEFWVERTETGGTVQGGIFNDAVDANASAGWYVGSNTNSPTWYITEAKNNGDCLATLKSLNVTKWQVGLDASDSNAYIWNKSGAFGADPVFRLDQTTGAALGYHSIKSKHATAGVGYDTGAGGTVTQLTSKATGVTLSKCSGQITTHNATLNAATIVSFTLTNTAIAAGDVMVLNHVSGGTLGAYTLNAACGAGTATITLRNNTAGNLGEALVIGFVVIKGATS